jgi:hypothetical protein
MAACAKCVPLVAEGVLMAREIGQIIGRAPRTWVVRVYVGRDAETRKRKYLNKTIHGGLRDAQVHLNRLLGERDLGRNLDSSKQTLNQYLDRWLEVCAKPRLRAKSFQDYEGLLRRYVRPQLGVKPLVSVWFGVRSACRGLWSGRTVAGSLPTPSDRGAVA